MKILLHLTCLLFLLLNTQAELTTPLRIDFSQGIDADQKQARRFGEESASLLQQINGRQVASVSKGQTLGYSLRQLDMPTEAGRFVFSLQVNGPVQGKDNDQIAFLMGDGSAKGFVSILYSESHHMFVAAIRSPGQGKNELEIGHDLTLGEELDLVFAWEESQDI